MSALVLVPHNPAWIGLFEKKKMKLQHALGARTLAIQHIGSAAIPQIYAKPLLSKNAQIKLCLKNRVTLI